LKVWAKATNGVKVCIQGQTVHVPLNDLLVIHPDCRLEVTSYVAPSCMLGAEQLSRVVIHADGINKPSISAAFQLSSEPSRQHGTQPSFHPPSSDLSANEANGLCVGPYALEQRMALAEKKREAERAFSDAMGEVATAQGTKRSRQI